VVQWEIFLSDLKKYDGSVLPYYFLSMYSLNWMMSFMHF
jgi:hypothetical protein